LTWNPQGLSNVKTVKTTKSSFFSRKKSQIPGGISVNQWAPKESETQAASATGDIESATGDVKSPVAGTVVGVTKSKDRENTSRARSVDF